MLLPRIVPAGAHYVRIPSSKRAAMRILLETVQRGSRYWTSGNVKPAKAVAFADRMAEMYAADATQPQRAYAKSRGRANTSLVMYPESSAEVRFWLLCTPGSGMVHMREQLKDAHDSRAHLCWGSQYELLHAQRPAEHHGGRTWTWRLTDERYDALHASMLRIARNPGRVPDRRDDLDALVTAVMRMPGFYMVRQQQLQLLRDGAQAWSRTHRESEEYLWPMSVPYLDKGFTCYHRPEPLRLDVLVRILGLMSSEDRSSDSGLVRSEASTDA
jgi:hypothetical protein